MNKRSLSKCGLLVAALIFSFSAAMTQSLAFPEAQGFGALASGGRGGQVYHVTNLNDSGTGSLRDAVSKPFRTVVFDVNGIIKSGSSIKVASNITIAGQTAPGEGISVYGSGISFSHQKNVIVRYMRFRGSINMPRGACVLVADSAQNMIFDHVSVEWGRWDNLHIKESSDITLQYCLIGEAIDPQRFGALLEGPKRLTIHHSLWINNHSRNPKAKADIEYINNIIYNWGTSGFVGGHSSADHHQDMEGNYFIAGPNSTKNFLSMFTKTDHVYQTGNFIDGNKDGVLNGATIADTTFQALTANLVKKKQNISPVAVNVQAAADAFNIVLKEAGSSIQRDAMDLRLISNLKSLGLQGKIFWTETEAGGHPKIAFAKAQLDSDKDGMPDSWESAHKLNPNDASDSNILVRKSQYTNLEGYLNEIAKANTSFSNLSSIN